MKYLIISLMGMISAFSFAADTMDVRVETPADERLKNQRLELSAALPAPVMRAIQQYLDSEPHQRTGLNPFVAWDIDLSATFTHEETGEQHRAIGFWYQSVERDPKNQHWKYRQTERPFRIRFAPPHAGKWKVEIEAAISKQQHITASPLEVNIAKSSAPGHVSVDSSRRYLQRNGKTIYPAGVNFPSPHVNNNLIYSQDRDEKLNLSAWTSFQNMIRQYGREGGEYFRFFMHPSSTDIEFEEVGYYQDRQHYAKEVDQMLSYCEKEELLINFNLMYHTMFMKLGDYNQFKYDYADNWHDSSIWPYKDINHISGYAKKWNSKTPSDMFLNEEPLRYLRQKTRYIMARWGYSTAVSSIELLCEPWHIDEHSHEHDTPYDSLGRSGNRARRAVHNYHRDIAGFIKDSLKIDHKILGAVGRFPVGSTGIYSHFTPATPQYADSTWYEPNIDFISISYYSKSPEKLLVSKTGSNNGCSDSENGMACIIERLHNTYDKPVLFGESDHGDGTHQCSKLQGHQLDIRRYALTGAAGHYIWAAFTYQVKGDSSWNDTRQSWKGIIDAKNHYNQKRFSDLLSGDQLLGREKKAFRRSDRALVEHHYIIDNSKSIASGYIYNRTFNVHTISDASKNENSPCFLNQPAFQEAKQITWKPQRIKVEGLKPFKKYNIHYFGYKGMELLNIHQKRSSIFGKITLKHPVLTPQMDQNPLINYRIEEAK
ncbi:MAG: DUF5060 domain-containing protein [Bacteroidota bacterium]